MTSKSYRWCSVPVCTNTSIKTPEKLFIFVPFDKKLRKKWLQLARRDLKGILPTSQFYFCEDHFDLPNDMANYMEYHVMGSVSQIRMKPGCVPSKFECQPDRRKRTSYANERRCIAKKQRREVIEEIEQKLQNKTTTTVTTEQLELEDPSPGTSGLQESTTKDAPKMLQNDMVNYMQYHVMGTVSKVRMKPDCVPTKFSWQSDAKTQLSGKDRSHIFGKGKKMIVEKCDEEPSSEETESCYTDSEMSANEDNPSGRTGVIHIIDKFKVKSVNQIYKSILIYQDQDTGFCFLRPLMKKCQVEIVAELHKIFLNYVPARNVDVHSCTKDMVDSIQDQMDLLCPKLKITFTKRNTGSTDLAMQIASKLSAWMSKTNRDEWELGCCVVQRDINTEGEPGNTPHCKLWRGLQAHRQTDRADTQASEVADTQTSEPEYFVKQEMDIGPETIEGLPCLKVDASQVEIKVERDDDDDTYS